MDTLKNIFYSRKFWLGVVAIQILISLFLCSAFIGIDLFSSYFYLAIIGLMGGSAFGILLDQVVGSGTLGFFLAFSLFLSVYAFSLYKIIKSPRVNILFALLILIPWIFSVLEALNTVGAI
jgi:hypothetical protein